MVASLLEMSDWGGTDAESLKRGIGDFFEGDGCFKIGDYETKLVSMTSDGASVNFGKKTGLMTRMSENRVWLIKIHCANHRIELAMKDAIKGTSFQEVDVFYIAFHALLKNSGKIKSEIKEATNALNIQQYSLPKLTGTRFVGHRRNAYQRLLKIWPAITVALENVVTDTKTRSETKAKVTGFLQNNFRSYRFLCLVCTYLDILELITPISKVYEGGGLLTSEIKPALVETANIDDEIDAAGGDEELLTSHLASFKVESEKIMSTFIKADDTRKQNMDKARTTLELDSMKYSENHRTHASDKKLRALTSLKKVLQERFGDLDQPIFENMKWYDPKNWENEKTYGQDQISALGKYFKDPLTAADYDETSVMREWKMFRTFVNANYLGLEAAALWEKISRYKKKEFPNLCTVAELIMCMSESNSTVERAFSLLSLLLSDRRLSLAHTTIEDLLVIDINDKLWTTQERENIILSAAEKYQATKRRVKRVEQPPNKVMRIETVSSDEEKDEEHEDSDFSDKEDEEHGTQISAFLTTNNE